ncbi:single-stranded DNA-binding protein [Rhizobiaceae bacterium BDR2-2]|uniref:Single-stranded DNA-binding protein n=2 Tax=Ectorhizobium quercum TaxID=2965071 RepID=A0AAE3MXY3_9HYPH|nr:single-stranded DNA-binding protein [Ectorhizobium quercum]
MQPERLKALEKAISALAPGEFHFPEIYGPDWNELYVGDKVKLGREFMTLVRKGYFAQVTDTGKKKAGGRVYLKAR